MFDRAAEVERKGGTAALATVVRARGAVPRRAGSKMLVFPGGRIEGTVGGGEMESRVIQEALEALQTGEPRLLHYTFQDPAQGDPGVCGGEMEVYVEPILPRRTLVVVGAGHVGKALAHLGHWLGFRVVVCDDREGFAVPEVVPDGDEYLTCALVDIPARLDITDRTFVVLTTRGVGVDVEGLPPLLETSAAYIGVIGSRKRWETCVSQLRERGVSEERIGRVTSPIGLELNAETPEEIAVSILAELIMRIRGGSGEAMAHSPVRRRRGQGA
jgi:xanthine dehydrogenase accessory factor